MQETTDNFTENDMRLFNSIKDRLSCKCDKTLWRAVYDLDTRTYKVKCLNCNMHLALRQLYNVEFKTKVVVNDGLVEDYDLLNDLEKVPLAINEIQGEIVQIQCALKRISKLVLEA